MTTYACDKVLRESFYNVHCTFLLGTPMHVTSVMPPITSGESIILCTFVQYI